MSSYYHYLREIVRNALLTMLENKRRTLLTTLGIVIGVSAVIIINGIGAGAQGLIVGQVKKLGSNLGTTVGMYNRAYKEFGKIDKDITKITGETIDSEILSIDKPQEE